MFTVRFRVSFSSLRILFATMIFCGTIAWHSDALLGQADDQADEASGAFDTELLIEDGGSVIAVRPAELYQLKMLRPILIRLRYRSFSPRGLRLVSGDIEQFVAVQSLDPKTTPQFICRLKDSAEVHPEKNEQFLRYEVSTVLEGEYKGESYLRGVYEQHGWQPELTGKTLALWRPDPLTIMVNDEDGIKSYINGTKPKQKLLATAQWKSVSEFSVGGILDASTIKKFTEGRAAERQRYRKRIEALRKQFKQDMPMEEDTDGMETDKLLQPIIENIEFLAYGFDVTKRIEALAAINCKTPAAARKTKEAIEALRELYKPLLTLQIELVEGTQKRSKTAFAKLQLDLIENAKITRNGNVVRIASSADAKIVIPGTPAAIADEEDVAFRLQSEFNGQKIAHAFHNFHDANKKMPPAIGYGPKGHAYSWRVAMLPFMGEEGLALHAQYNFEEAWDSESNLKLLAKMPEAFRNPKDAADSTNTAYLALYGPGSMMWKEGGTLADMKDGTSNTIGFVESKRKVPWTKPEDIAYDPFDPEKIATELGGYYEGGFHAVFGDGSVRFIDDTIKEEHLHSLIQIDDGAIVPE